MMDETNRLVDMLVETSDQLKAIYGKVQVAHTAQWQTPSPRPKAEPLDPGTHERTAGGAIRQKGTITDTTGRTVVDPARLALRQELQHAVTELARVQALLQGVAIGLDYRLVPYLT